MKKIISIAVMLLLTFPVGAQHLISIDVASIRNLQSSLNGLNVSSFYHFNKHLIGGIEVNRFFPVHRFSEGEEITIAALDIELNMHYLLELRGHLKMYPITGISHISERETSIEKAETLRESFWSLNTGAGVLWELGHWTPHIEYSFAWGQHNQQYLLAGISYEIQLGKRHHK